MNLKYLVSIVLGGGLLLPVVAHSESVTSITIEDVGRGGLNAYSSNPDNVAGAFQFAPIDQSTYDTDTNGLDCYSGAVECFLSDVAPIDVSQANSAGSFSTGFIFGVTPFVPKTTGPVNADISIVNGNPVLTFPNPATDLPFAGDYGSSTITEFLLPPQLSDPGTCAFSHIPLTVYWVERVNNTDEYLYKIAWTHCISAGTSFDGSRAHWILEGRMRAPDTTPPQVASSNPSNTATNIPTNTPYRVTFNESMDPASITTSTFIVAPSAGGGTECASIAASNNNTVFTCNPVGGFFSASTQFDVTLTTGITDATEDTAVNLASQVVRTFTTGVGADVTAPNFVSATPTSGAIDQATDTVVTVTFDEAMAASTLDAITLTQGSNPVSATVDTSDNLTFTLTPANNLMNLTTYTINVAAGDGVNGANDASGNALASLVTQSFTTVAAASLTDTDSGVSASIDMASGASFTSLDVLTPAQLGGEEPDRVDLDDYFVDFTIINVVGGQIAVDIVFPESLSGKTIYKFINGGYMAMTEGAAVDQYQRLNDTTIRLLIADNGPLDADTTAGTIRDPIGTGVDLGAKPLPGSLGGGWWLLLAGPLLLVARRRLRK